MHACMYACVSLYSIYRPQLSSVEGYASSEVYCMYTCMYVCVTPHSPCRLQLSSLEEYMSRGVFCFVCMVACMFVCMYERMYDRHTHILIHTQVIGTHTHKNTSTHTLFLSARIHTLHAESVNNDLPNYRQCLPNLSRVRMSHLMKLDETCHRYLAPQVQVG